MSKIYDQKLRDYLIEKYSVKSLYGYEDGIHKYQEYLGANGQESGQLEVLGYIGFLRDRGLSPKTIRNALQAIKIYYRYLQTTGQRKDHPCKSLQLRDQINRCIPIESLYTMEQMERFCKEHRTKQTFLQRRDEVLLSLLIYQALTNTEIAELKVENVVLEQGEVFIAEGAKGAKNTNMSRTLALKPKQILLIDRYLNQDREGLLQRNRNPTKQDIETLLLTKYGKKIVPSAVARQINHGHEKFMKMRPLKIRQSVILHKLKEGHNVRVVQAFAGHRSIMSTEAYQMDKIDELKKGINKYHPLQ